MKKLAVITILLCASAIAAKAQGQYVAPHYRADGTYVPGYYRSPRDNTPTDNYGYEGNRNPYTGREGTQRVTPTEGQYGTYNGRTVIFQNGQWHYVN